MRGFGGSLREKIRVRFAEADTDSGLSDNSKIGIASWASKCC